MRIAALADLHGHLPETPPCDLLLIAGDVCPAAGHSLAVQRAWCEGPFAEWLRHQPAREIVGVAGNHDFIAQASPSVVRKLPWRYLCDESTVVDGMRVHGSPWTPTFYDWAFMQDDADLARHWDLIPDDVAVLVTHGPPHGLGDRTERGTHEGSLTLRARIEQLDDLRLHVFGHIHENPGHWPLGNATLANVTVVDLDYRPVHPVRIFDL